MHAFSKIESQNYEILPLFNHSNCAHKYSHYKQQKKADSYSVKIPMIIRVTKKGAIFDCKCVFILLKSLLEVIAKICLS